MGGERAVVNHEGGGLRRRAGTTLEERSATPGEYYVASVLRCNYCRGKAFSLGMYMYSQTGKRFQVCSE